MSEYATVQGWYWFDTEDAYESTLDEHEELCGDLESHETDSGWVLEVPFNLYRNLHRHTSDIGAKADAYLTVSATMDGDLSGYINTEDGEVSIDLLKWASTRDDFNVDVDNYPDTGTQQELVNAFIENQYTHWEESVLSDEQENQ